MLVASASRPTPALGEAKSLISPKFVRSNEGPNLKGSPGHFFDSIDPNRTGAVYCWRLVKTYQSKSSTTASLGLALAA